MGSPPINRTAGALKTSRMDAVAFDLPAIAAAKAGFQLVDILMFLQARENIFRELEIDKKISDRSAHEFFA